MNESLFALGGSIGGCALGFWLVGLIEKRQIPYISTMPVGVALVIIGFVVGGIVSMGSYDFLFQR